ncbi:MAG: 50S ribosomal protein L3 [uncultured bacterium]|nr:MAG: 50S ribosomal protein L3 [uncultured bacterium]
MTIGIIGKKLGMTHQFDSNGTAVPVTVIQAGPCVVIQKKTAEKDDYTAIQLGFEDAKETRLNKPETGHFKKNSIPLKKIVKEIRVDNTDLGKYNVGDNVTVKDFEKCEYVDVIGTSKGRGFTGVIKRHNFHRPKQTHGTHEKFRHGGSLGCRFPQHVVKGKKMAGHFGSAQITTQSLKLLSIRPDDNVIIVKGAIPGANKGIVIIRPAIRKKSLKKTA